MERTNIYVLLLEGGRYYVGKSDNPQKRFQEHLDGSGSAWTRRYKPIAMEKVIPNCSAFDEDKYTKEYMAKYGMNNVRGGTYPNIELDEFQKETLNRELWAAQNKCTQCGRSGHFIKDCYARTDVSGNEIVYEDSEESESEEEDTILSYMKTGISVLSTLHKAIASNERPRNSSTITCYRCKRPGHYANECYASTNVYGKRIY